MNDLDGEVYNLFCVIQDRPDELAAAWFSMPLHEELWKQWKVSTPQDPVWRAVRFLFRSNFGFLGKAQTLKWNNKNAKRTLQERIAATHELLYDVEFMHCDFRQMLRRIPLTKGDRTKALIYADPPYLDTDNNYGEASAWSLQDTTDLFGELVASGMRFVLSEFDHPKVLQLASDHQLQVINIGERYNLRNVRREILVTNARQRG